MNDVVDYRAALKDLISAVMLHLDPDEEFDREDLNGQLGESCRIDLIEPNDEAEVAKVDVRGGSDQAGNIELVTPADVSEYAWLRWTDFWGAGSCSIAFDAHEAREIVRVLADFVQRYDDATTKS